MDINLLQKFIRLEIQRDAELKNTKDKLSDIVSNITMFELDNEFAKKHPDNMYKREIPESLIKHLKELVPIYEFRIKELESI